jgi:hypothetical protein
MVGTKPWSIPQIWDGDTVFILGGGPSLIGFDARCLTGRRVIAVNCSFRLGQFDVMFYGDPLWPDLYGKGLEDFGGLKVTVREEHQNRPDVRVVFREPHKLGLSQNPEKLHWNLSSGACAINLATLLGAGKIVLLGFDMKQKDGQNNYHRDYVGTNGTHAAVGNYELMRNRFPAIAGDLTKLKIPCVNACPDSAIDCFPKCEIVEAVA